MNKIMDLIRAQPVYAMGVIQTGIGLALALGLPISTVAAGALVTFSAALLSFAVQKVVTAVADPKLPSGASVTVMETGEKVVLP